MAQCMVLAQQAQGPELDTAAIHVYSHTNVLCVRWMYMYVFRQEDL